MNNAIERYEKWFIDNNLLFQSEVEAIQQIIPSFKNGIEIGVGTGIFAEKFGINLGVDPSSEMGKVAISKGINVIQGKAEQLPIDDNSHDLVLMITVDCFLQNLLESFNEIHRILHSDGFFLIAFLDRATKLGMEYEKFKNSNPSYYNANFHSAKEIIEALKESGFSIHKKRQTVFTLKNEKQPIKKGTGEGVFAIVLAKKE